MCDQWKTDPSLFAKELTTKEWFSFVDSACRLHSAVIIITGGEPFLRSDIFDIINYIHKKEMHSHLCSNGTLLNENMILEIKNAGLDSISISLDSYIPEIHNNLRGVNCFDQVIENIKLLRCKIKDIMIGINYVITKKNFLDMNKIIPFAEELGVNQIKFDPIHTHLIYQKSGNSDLKSLLFDEEDLPVLNQEIDKLIKSASETKLLTNSNTFLRGILKLYNGKYKKLKCYAGYISCAIGVLGEISPCDGFKAKESIKDKSLEEIWDSKSFQRLRRKVDSCSCSCWDTTHAELNIRCSLSLGLKEISQSWKEINYYLD